MINLHLRACVCTVDRTLRNLRTIRTACKSIAVFILSVGRHIHLCELYVLPRLERLRVSHISTAYLVINIQTIIYLTENSILLREIQHTAIFLKSIGNIFRDIVAVCKLAVKLRLLLLGKVIVVNKKKIAV